VGVLGNRKSQRQLDLLIHKSDDPNTTKQQQHNPSLFITQTYVCTHNTYTYTPWEEKLQIFFFFFSLPWKRKRKEGANNNNWKQEQQWIFSLFSSFFSHHIFSLSIIPLKPHVSISLFLSLKRNDFLVCIVLLSLEIVLSSWKKLWLLGFSLCLIIQLYKM